MKRLTILLLFSSNIVFGQIFANDTTMSGTYNANGQAMYIYGKISGNVTLTNGIIIANAFQQIFDTTVTIGSGMQCERFSAMWYGAKPSLTDNSRQLQYAIDASINKNWQLYLPSGVYKTKDSLIVKTGDYGNYGQSTIYIYGDAAMWGDGGSEILYSGDFCALGFQLNKGSTLRNVILKGGWVSPSASNTIAYYNTSLDDYTNQGTGGNGNGLWIDPFGNWNQRSGSTGCKFSDIQVKNFMTDIHISNSISQNGDILEFDNVQFGDAKYGVVTSQPQEKGNVFNGVYSWGAVHTLFNIISGNYTINGGNIAGACISLFNISSSGYFPVHISNLYAENFGTIGTITTSLPIGISNCVFDFAYQSIAGKQTLLTSGTNVKFDNSQFRYYGSSDTLNLATSSAFENCFFSGVLNGITNATFITYQNGMVVSNHAPIYISSTDTIQPPSIKISLRSSNQQQ